MSLRLTHLIYAAAGALALAVSPAIAQDKTFELKLAHWVPPSHPLQKALEDWGSSVEKASGGTLKFKVYPSQQLGKAFDHYDMARDGIADFTYVNPGYQPGRFPIIAAGELPFLVGDAKAERNRLAAQGVEVSEIREPVPGTNVFDAQDPDGNRFSLESRRVLA